MPTTVNHQLLTSLIQESGFDDNELSEQAYRILGKVVPPAQTDEDSDEYSKLLAAISYLLAQAYLENFEPEVIELANQLKKGE